MTKEELAAKLNGREYMEVEVITKEEEAQAKASGLCVAFGYSDDCLELRGAWDDEISAYNGTLVKVNADGPVINECDDEDCPYFRELMEKTKDFILAKYGEEPGFSWWIESSLPFAPFDMMEDGEKFCRGIVVEVPSK